MRKLKKWIITILVTAMVFSCGGGAVSAIGEDMETPWIEEGTALLVQEVQEAFEESEEAAAFATEEKSAADEEDGDADEVTTEPKPAEPVFQAEEQRPARTLLAIIQDALAPDCAIYIYGSWEGETLRIGQEVTLEAVLEGYDNVEYTLQWQVSPDGEIWVDLENAIDPEYTFTLTRENVSNFWRIQVIITGVKEA